MMTGKEIGLPAAAVFLFLLGASRGDPPEGKMVRVRIPPGAMRHEQGFCYIARMGFGEDGDKTTRNGSRLELYENGRLLGPAHALHKDIREKGRGRYSHWLRNTLYFSTSDNTDPRTNGRVYEVASRNPESALGGLGRFAGRSRRRVEVVRTPQHAFDIDVNSLLDAENTRTRTHGGIEIAFQPNVSVTIENTGDVPIRNPWLIANGRGNWDTLEHLTDEFLRGARTPQEKALFIWQNARENRYHFVPLFEDDEFHDPVRIFNCYGFALCDDAGRCTTVLWKQAGLGFPFGPDPLLRGLHGHVQGEVFVGGDWQFLDVDQDVFFLDRENRRPVSGDACAWDHDLVRREVVYGPRFGGWDSSASNASLFGPDDFHFRGGVSGHTMAYTLRPGERVEFRWDNIGKVAAQDEKHARIPPFFSNSRFVYVPRLTADQWERARCGACRVHGVAMTGDGLCFTGETGGEIVWRLARPWVICGGRLRAEFANARPGDRFALLVRPDGAGEPVTVWEGGGKGRATADVSIDPALACHSKPAKYGYEVTVSVRRHARKPQAEKDGGKRRRGTDQDAPVLRSIRFETDVMTAPLSLPGLRRGRNRILFRCDNRTDFEATVTYVWRECRVVRPPPPPALIAPRNGETVRSTFVPLRWRPVRGAAVYHLQVSRYADFRLPWRPNYDVIIRESEWSVPYRGMFSPDMTYYWRVRARSNAGVWSEWSGVRTFRWEGPCVPLDVHREWTGDGIVLRWLPNPRGTRPVAYDVYGSDERGFSVHKKPYRAWRRGRVPGNFVTRVSGNSLLVVGPAAAELPNANRCWYRVVAVDARGVESVPSSQVEMPHPFIWTRPPQRAVVGKTFTYQPGVVRSLGDDQYPHKGVPRNSGGREVLRFSLIEGPDWLRIDPETGRVTGIPGKPGEAAVRIRVEAGKGHRDEQAFRLTILPSPAHAP